jgi:hypothetical protein
MCNSHQSTKTADLEEVNQVCAMATGWIYTQPPGC